MWLLAYLCLTLASQSEVVPLLRPGEGIEGEITDTDLEIHTPTLDAEYVEAPTVGKRFRIQVENTGRYYVELRSFSFDAYLVLRDAEANVLAEDDDGSMDTHALLMLDELVAGRAYLLDACGLHGERGAFDLVLKSGLHAPPTPAEMELDELQFEIEELEAIEGPDSEALAIALDEQAGLFQELGDYEAARPLFERVLEITERVLGPDHPDTATSLENLAFVLQDLGKYRAARPLLERALAITENAFGADDPETALSLDNLAFLLQDLGNYKAARPLLERALAITENALGVDHPDTATSLNNLADLYLDIGNHKKALPLLERALAITENALGADHPDTATSLNNLADLYLELGDYQTARPLLERALDVTERALGPDHVDTATSLTNLAYLHQDLGDYQAARPLLERALQNTERAFGADHPDTAASVDNLAVLLQDLGDYEAARPLCERALATTERTLGAHHPDTATTLNNLALLLHDLGDYEAARPLFERALAISEKTLGTDHPDTATSLDNLALLLRDLGEFEAARPLYERALGITEKALGNHHPYTAAILENLAGLLRTIGDHDAARQHCERALEIRNETLGADHPHTTATLNNLALLLADVGDVELAWEVSGRDENQRRLAVEHVLSSLSEGESYLYLVRLLWQLELRLSLVELLGAEKRATAAVEAYEELLDWKGRIARLLLKSRERLALEASPAERSLLKELRICQRKLSKLVLETDVTDPAEHKNRLERMRAERNRIELDLRRAGSSNTDVESTSFADLRASLPESTAVVDFFVHRTYRPAQAAWTDPRLSAWITRPDSEAPIRLDLGPASTIEAAVRAFLEDLVAQRGVRIQVKAERGADPSADLRRLIWDPIDAHLEGITTIFVSPDGVLGTLPFETLTRADGDFLIEELSFVYVQDVASLARRPTEAAVFDSLFAIGAVDFRKRAKWSSTPEDGLLAQAETVSAEDSSALRGGFTDYWGRLPATEYESQVAFDMHEDAFGDDGRRALLQGAESSEERLKHELGRYSVLHLATHGFFQPEGMASMWESAKGERGGQKRRLNAESRALLGKHPGLLSGLVCAGANRPAAGDGDDGYLTAEEVGWLDLTRVELVVLSACETGLGRAQSGEGLIGLRRAFHTAGARTVISSLWSVRDDSTARLMQDFYKNLFLKGTGRHEALRAAQLDMLERNRVEQGHALPHTWGAFVLSGDGR